MDDTTGQNTQNTDKNERKITLYLSQSVYDDYVAAAEVRKTSVGEVVGIALGLGKIAIRETRAGNSLVVINPDGVVLKELVLPERGPPRPGATTAPPPAHIPA